MFLSKRHLDRRTFLRGMGATVALPLLDAMVPARVLLASTRPVPRLAFVYFPHGAVMDEWMPPTAGRGGQLGRILEPLSPVANRLTIVSGVENRHAYGPVHAITPGTWLSGTSPRESGNGTHGATIDQLAADYLGRETALPSLALAAEEPVKIGAGLWEGQYDESLATTISFRRAGVPVPMQSNPRAVFNKLFARGGTGDASDAHTAGATSVLDLVAADAARLRTRLGPADRTALGDYLEAVRDAERRVEHLESRPCLGRQSDGEVEQRFIERLTLMFDLTALAFRADITRVASLMMAAEASSMTYGHIGVPESFHLVSHHQHDPEKLDRLVRIQAFHTRTLANFARTLEAAAGRRWLDSRSLADPVRQQHE